MGNQQSKQNSEGPSSPRSASQSHGSHTTRSHSIRGHHIRRTSVHSSAPSVDAPQSNSSHSPPIRRPSTQSYHPRTAHAASPPPSGKHDTRMGNSQSRHADAEKDDRSRKREPAPPSGGSQQPTHHDAHTHPVQVPDGGRAARSRGPAAHHGDIEPSSVPPTDYAPLSNLNFPPRLPLPIQEEVYTPGSPIITSADVATDATAIASPEALMARGDAEARDGEGTLPHPTSLLSNNTTMDEEEEHEIEGPEEAKGKTVPTVVKWRQPGTKVYITGTFASWSRKYRMHREYVEVFSLFESVSRVSFSSGFSRGIELPSCISTVRLSSCLTSSSARSVKANKPISVARNPMSSQRPWSSRPGRTMSSSSSTATCSCPGTFPPPWTTRTSS